MEFFPNNEGQDKRMYTLKQLFIIALGLFKTIAGWVAGICGALTIIAFPVACTAEEMADIQHGLFIAGIIFATALTFGALAGIAGAIENEIEERTCTK